MLNHRHTWTLSQLWGCKATLSRMHCGPMCTPIHVANVAEAGMRWGQLAFDRPGNADWCKMLDGQILCSQTKARDTYILGVLRNVAGSSHTAAPMHQVQPSLDRDVA